MKQKKVYTALFTGLLISLIAVSCDDSFLNPASDKNGFNINSSSSAAYVNKQTNLITTDPTAFVEKLKSLNNENEILIALKKASAPRISKTFLKELPLSNLIIVLPKTPAHDARRSTPGFAPVNNQSRKAVKDILKAQAVNHYTALDFGNIITAKLSNQKAVVTLTALLNSPYVDYIEANQRYKVYISKSKSITRLIAPSFLSSNASYPTPLLTESFTEYDDKHTFHNVLEAWNYTKGSGARVGVLDTGFSFDQGTNSYHPDGKLLSSTKGIKKLGFVDDYGDDGYDTCHEDNTQPYGACVAWDDNYTAPGHGTIMAGVVGENDDEGYLSYVGIMPEGLTVSMKMIQNCLVSNGCPDNSEYAFIESDDWLFAIQWARFNEIRVLSMSFGSADISSSIYNALYDAYYQDDVLLLAATGNQVNASYYPAKLPFVMGVGGVYIDSTSYGSNEYEDVSGLAGGGSLRSECPSEFYFCYPEGYDFHSPSFGAGGTSMATAIVAGIAGLVRANEPFLSAPEVWNRLVSTSYGPNNIVDAIAAVTNNIPLSVTINGPTYINTSGTYSWEAMPESGDAGYSYIWEYSESGSLSWQTVGNSKIYARNVAIGDPDFILRVTVTSGNEEDTAEIYVTVSDSDCPPNELCLN